MKKKLHTMLVLFSIVISHATQSTKLSSTEQLIRKNTHKVARLTLTVKKNGKKTTIHFKVKYPTPENIKSKLNALLCSK